jgi:predicted MPP superfamily phosphohydrolase
MGSRSALVLVVVGIVLVAAGHYYLWARLVRDVDWGASATQALTWILVGLAASIPVGVIAGRFVPPRWSVWWLAPVYVWIGAAFLLVLSLLSLEAFRLGLSVATPRLRGPDPHRRQALARGLALLAAAVASSATGLALVEGRKLRVRRVEVPIKKLPKALDGFRIAQLTDMHVGPTIGRDFVERVVAMVNDLSPDLVAITGDLVDASVKDLAHQVAPLADLVSTHGAYFVTGNHEYHAGAPEWCEHLGRLGVRVLRNEHVALERGGQTLHLAGIDDYESATVAVGHGADLPKAVAGRDPSRALVLLAHQPKAVHEAVRHGVDLQLSGHTHGGQLWPLGWLQRLGQPVIAGLAKFGETFLYVSRGTGHSGPPMRLAAPAEITQIILRSGSN